MNSLFWGLEQWYIGESEGSRSTGNVFGIVFGLLGSLLALSILIVVVICIIARRRRNNMESGGIGKISIIIHKRIRLFDRLMTDNVVYSNMDDAALKIGANYEYPTLSSTDAMQQVYRSHAYSFYK